ncbi:restriction endonuclease subunit S [Acetobacterium fimetarium]|uniref:Restriction endonuclease subunit S n=1 Tax=Acetobacterium fimetarium TaxID=52691 RepID=A0ABR6WTQ7_9FIRM|nr:restriction endonuclease subunit S [Acetobacterium fimetarium]MBC3803997.1 restriction endonuclease subunit S [Acetobacterium fimetarium]
MAKKKQELTSEELLAEALVREEDWPYKVPGNWVWTRLGSNVTITTGKKDANYGTANGKYMFFTCAAEPIRCNGFSFDGESILLAGNGANVGLALYYEGKFEAYQRTYVIQKKKSLLLKYVYYHFKSFWKEYNADKQYGSATNYIKLGNFQEYPIPLPPLAEQQRIVDRIESLFDKLDQAKELIQEALDSFESRKAAILHQAFTGELTKKWRKVNGVGMESWSVKPLSELCTSFQYGTSKKSLTSGKVVVIRMGNLQQGEIRWNNLAYTDDEEDIEKYLLKKGDVLFNRTNSPELVGKTSVYRGEFPAIFAGYLIRLKNNDMLNGYYLNYMMNSQRAKIYCNSVKTDGVNQSNINAKKIAAFEIPHCSIPEQQEIVRILDDLFAKEQNAKDLIDLIDQIEAMKKTILGKAFRGELGTNEAGEESVLTLLKNLFSQKEGK